MVWDPSVVRLDVVTVRLDIRTCPLSLSLELELYFLEGVVMVVHMPLSHHSQGKNRHDEQKGEDRVPAACYQSWDASLVSDGSTNESSRPCHVKDNVISGGGGGIVKDEGYNGSGLLMVLLLVWYHMSAKSGKSSYEIYPNFTFPVPW